jgi:CO dehydrogenase nickel-insertion accessory protein CooC1
VYVVDADSTNLGLHRALGIAEPPDPLLIHFGGMIFSGGRVTCPVDDPTPLPGAEILLEDLPRRYVAEGDPGIFLLSLGKLGAAGAGAGCDGPIGKIARDLAIRSRGGAGVTLVDFKAGFEDAARGVVVSLDWAVVVVDPTQASLVLAADMKAMVEKLRAGAPPATSHLGDPALAALARRRFRDAPLRGVLVVLNRVPDDETEAFLRARLAEHGIEPVACIREDPAIRRAWLRGDAVRADAPDLVARLESLPGAVALRG